VSEARPSRDAALFLHLVLGLSQSAMIALGKLMNPITRKVETDLDAARDTIDTLAALEARTRGNLEPDEARVLQQVLADLRLNYVDGLKKSAAPGPEPAAPPEAPAASTLGTPPEEPAGD
jgi:tellurite resistance protein